MEGGGLPLLVTLNVSVRHCVACVTSFAPPVMRPPLVALPMLWVDVAGPVMTKLWKSRRS